MVFVASLGRHVAALSAPPCSRSTSSSSGCACSSSATASVPLAAPAGRASHVCHTEPPAPRGTPSWGRLLPSRPQRGGAAAAAGAPASNSNLSKEESASQLRQNLRIDLGEEGRINWLRWEMNMLRAAVVEAEKEAEAQDPEELDALEALVATTSGIGGGGGAGAAAPGAAAWRQWDNPAAHEALARDRVLQAAWREALAAGAEHIRDKVVLDLGCGVGLLSMMVAQAGARHVYAVDASEGAAEAARRVVKANGLQDKITVITGAVPGVSLPEDVDVIVSNWAGPGLLGGGMLPALAIARKQFLRPGGLVLPDRASLWAVGLDDRDALAGAKEAWQRAAQGFDLSAVMAQVVRFPRSDVLTRRNQLVTEPAQVAAWELGSLAPQDVLRGEEGRGYFSSPLSLTALKDERLFGLMLYFDLTWTFGGALEAAGKPPVAFTTHPTAPPTHYRQLVVNFPRSLRVAAGDVVSVRLSAAPGEGEHRDLDLGLGVEFGDAAASAQYRVEAARGGL